MKVKVLLSFAKWTDNDCHIYHEGDELELDGHEAARMIDGGIVVPVKAEAAETASLPQPENAAHRPARAKK